MRSVLLTLMAVMAAAVGAADRQPERLLGLVADDEKGQITFVVWASGCAKKADFRVERSGKTLTLVRLQRDACKMMPQRMDLTFTLAEVGLKPHDVFTVTNPFTASVMQASMQ